MIARAAKVAFVVSVATAFRVATYPADARGGRGGGGYSGNRAGAGNVGGDRAVGNYSGNRGNGNRVNNGNVNVGNSVNIGVDNDWGGGYSGFNYPIAAGVAVGAVAGATAAAIGSSYYPLPGRVFALLRFLL